MARGNFGQMLKALRKRQGATLRDFCLQNKLDPGNYSKLERGRLQPPQSTEILDRYARALGVEPDTDDWINLFDAAAADRGQLPDDLLSDEELLTKLPVLFRTLRGSPVPADKLDELIEQVREG